VPWSVWFVRFRIQVLWGVMVCRGVCDSRGFGCRLSGVCCYTVECVVREVSDSGSLGCDAIPWSVWFARFRIQVLWGVMLCRGVCGSRGFGFRLSGMRCCAVECVVREVSK
jgi:hypothetical protein